MEDRTYVIDPGATDPDLIRSLTPLGEDPGKPRARATAAHRRRRTVATTSREASVRPPRRPLLWLLGAFVLGPFALLLTARPENRLRRLILAGSAAALASVAAWLYLAPPSALAPGDRRMVFQGAAVLAAAMAWLTVWCLGLIAASDRCPEGPLSRRGHRRPLVAATVGLCCPGLGLLLSGRRVRCVVTLAVVGAGAVATLLLLRAPFSWQAHRADPDPMFSDLQVERIFLVLAGTLAAGALAWLVSALEGGRLAAGPRVVRAVSGADRVPAALLISLVALGIWFRPLDAAHGLDRLTHQLADGGLRLAPLWTARAAAFLAPAEPVLELRVAERQEALGRHEEATATRQELYRRWRSLALSEGARPAAEDAGNDAGDPGRAGWSRAGLAPTSPLPLAKASSPAPPPPAR